MTFLTALKALPVLRASFQRKSLKYLLNMTDNRRKYRNNRKTRRKKVLQMKNYNPLLCFISQVLHQINPCSHCGAQVVAQTALRGWRVKDFRFTFHKDAMTPSGAVHSVTKFLSY